MKIRPGYGLFSRFATFTVLSTAVLTNGSPGATHDDASPHADVSLADVSLADVSLADVSLAVFPLAVQSPLSTNKLFVENHGAWDSRAKYVSVSHGARCFITDEGWRIQCSSLLENPHGQGRLEPSSEVFRFQTQSIFFTFDRPDETAEVRLEGLDPLPAKVHRLLTERQDLYSSVEPACGETGESYSRVRFREMYPGIDVDIYGVDGGYEYDLILSEGASLEDVAITCEGADSLEVKEDGSLVARIGPLLLEQTPPVAWVQGIGVTKRGVRCRFTQLGANRFGFSVDEGQKEGETLIIDPGIRTSTWLGGSGDEVVLDMAPASDGGLYVIGLTSSVDFPTTPGALQENASGTSDAFLVKMNATLSEVEFATYIGGNGDDAFRGIHLDSLGRILVVGWSNSPDFPVTPGGFGDTYQGGGALGFDCIVARLNAAGSVIEFAGFLGAEEHDLGAGVTTDSMDDVIVCGWTDSPGFPTTSGAFDPSWNGFQDAFVAKIASDGQSIVFSTFIGGTEEEDFSKIIADDQDDLWFIGRTFSPNYPSTANADDPTWNGSYEIVVSKLSSDGSQLLYSTFMGGVRRDEGKDLKLDSISGTLYITGVARSPDFPTTLGVYSETLNGHYDAFVASLDLQSGIMLAATFVGGITTDDGLAIDLDQDGHPIIVGLTWSNNWPTTMGAIDRELEGPMDAFLAKLNPDLTELEYSTFLGGPLDDTIYSVRSIGVDRVMIGGRSRGGIPTTLGAFDETHNGGHDGFVMEVDPNSQCPSNFVHYGQGWPGTLGEPTVGPTTNPILCNDLSLEIVTSTPSSTQGFLLFGVLIDSFPTHLGGTLLLVPRATIGLTLPPTPFQISSQLPCSDDLCGVSVYVQVLVLDDGASAGVSFSQGLGLILGS